ncbi:hypothetical protein ACFL6C_01150 [Myxococcota bacterium]
MIEISLKRIKIAQKKLSGWSFRGQVTEVHGRFRVQNGRVPPLRYETGDERPTLQGYLVAWNADLGARHKMRWTAFLKDYRKIIGRLTGLPSMGSLSAAQINN